MNHLLESGSVSLYKGGRVRVCVRSGDGLWGERWCWDLEANAIVVVAAAAHAVAEIASWRVHVRWVLSVLEP